MVSSLGEAQKVALASLVASFPVEGVVAQEFLKQIMVASYLEVVVAVVENETSLEVASLGA